MPATLIPPLTGPVPAAVFPRHAPPVARTGTADPLPYRVWVRQGQRWCCAAAFAECETAQGFAWTLRRRVAALAFQSPEGVELAEGV